MPEVIYLNGRFVGPEEAVVSINDRGFLFGDAIYEVMRSYGGRLWALEAHLRRLERSLREVDMAGVEVEEIGEVVEEAYRRSGFPEALVYVQITRGVAPRRHAYSRDMRPTVLVHVRDSSPMLGLHTHEGVAAITAPDLRWGRCDIKSTNLLPNVLAQTKARDQGAHEAILVDEQGYVTEATSASVFCVEDGVVLTRPSGPEILPGITREVVMALAREQGMAVREERVSVERLRKAEEVFLAGTGDDVRPVVKLDGVVIGDGRPGPITRRLLEALLAKVGASHPASSASGGARRTGSAEGKQKP